MQSKINHLNDYEIEQDFDSYESIEQILANLESALDENESATEKLAKRIAALQDF